MFFLVGLLSKYKFLLLVGNDRNGSCTVLWNICHSALSVTYDATTTWIIALTFTFILTTLFSCNMDTTFCLIALKAIHFLV
jgi:hypothetical protein